MCAVAHHASFDSIIEYDANDPRHSTPTLIEQSPDFLAQITSPHAPNHDLFLKVGAICSITRNLSVAKGLVKNQHVVIVGTRPRYIEVKLLNRGNRPDTTHCIPRINFDFKPPFVSFTIRRKQFPLRLAYAATFNSCQGLTFDKVGIDVRNDVFAHGQLYTALSRVRSRFDAWLLIPPDKPDVANIVYDRLLLH
jgi:hypothetical protein